MKRNFAILWAAVILFCFAGYANAASVNFEGRPSQLDAGKSSGYFIWQDKEGLHIRARAAEDQHTFSGEIRTDGAFEGVFGKMNGKDDYVKVDNDRDKIRFQFTTLTEETGIDLYVNRGTYVKFNLSLDGDPMNPGNIFIGSENWHPESYKFTIMHDEDKRTGNDDQTVIIIDGGFWWHWGPPHGPGPGPGPRWHRW